MLKKVKTGRYFVFKTGGKLLVVTPKENHMVPETWYLSKKLYLAWTKVRTAFGAFKFK